MNHHIKRLGLGTMRMNFQNEERSVQTIRRALDAGITMINTGEFYGAGASEMVLANALKGVPREHYQISLKYGALPQLGGGLYGIDPNVFNIRAHLQFSLTRLRMDYVDIFEPCRQDETVPVEVVMEELIKLKTEGWIRKIALSETDAQTLERAEKIAHVDYIEVGYSLVNRGIERGVLKKAKELGTQVIVFGLNGHGMLERLVSPDCMQRLKECAYKNGLTLAQLMYAWGLNKQKDVMALTGCTSLEHLDELIEASAVELSDAGIREIEDCFTGMDVFHTALGHRRCVNGHFAD